MRRRRASPIFQIEVGKNALVTIFCRVCTFSLQVKESVD